MEYPLLNITDHNWEPERVDGQLVFYEFIYVGRKIFDEYHKGKFYCDCTGKVYKAVDIVLPASIWRRFFGFLPMVYKCRSIFEETELQLTVNQLRDFVIDRISEMPEDDFNQKWIEQLKQANSHKEIIDGQIS
ncbi:MAG: hypothetical protein HEP71_16955 [Roseivirga sp.]|nr:hypothetical protein [Roseivirga sp.]